jgi:hypothetical protein
VLSPLDDKAGKQVARQRSIRNPMPFTCLEPDQALTPDGKRSLYASRDDDDTAVVHAMVPCLASHARLLSYPVVGADQRCFGDGTYCTEDQDGNQAKA